MFGNNITINQIVAIDENGGIGINGDIPWSLSKDWEHFLRLTTKPQVNKVIFHLNNKFDCKYFFSNPLRIINQENLHTLYRLEILLT